MRFRIYANRINDNESKQLWYDISLRLWQGWVVDNEGNQIGNSEYFPSSRKAHAFAWLEDSVPKS